MLLLSALLFVCWLHGAYSSKYFKSRPVAESSTDSYRCSHDLSALCSTYQVPDSYEEMFHARRCLAEHIDNLSEECFSYIYKENPSAIESCQNELNTLCADFAIDEIGGLHRCLGLPEVVDNIDPKCRIGLETYATPDLYWHSYETYLVTPEIADISMVQYIRYFVGVPEIRLKVVKNVGW